MNIGALALIPSRRSAITCPISWINSSTVNPAANAHPNTKLYAAIDTIIVPAVVSSFSFGKQQDRRLSFVSSATIATSTPASPRLERGRR